MLTNDFVNETFKAFSGQKKIFWINFLLYLLSNALEFLNFSLRIRFTVIIGAKLCCHLAIARFEPMPEEPPISRKGSKLQ